MDLAFDILFGGHYLNDPSFVILFGGRFLVDVWLDFFFVDTKLRPGGPLQMPRGCY